MENKQMKCVKGESCLHCGSNYCRFVDELDQLKAENEKLKKGLMKKDEVNTFFNTPIEGWSNDPCGICKLKQTLAEIKEIIKQGVKIHDDIIVSKQILQKISEVENANI